jgi:large subunit ribosomal protein L4
VNVNVRTLSGGIDSTISVSDSVFAKKYNESLIHQVVTAYMAGSRQGSKAQKTRSEVSGGGSKPWKQKGTGRARAGSIRSPIFRKGGVTFAAKPRSYQQKINRKMYRAAICSILSELLKNERLLVVNNFKIESKKTKDFITQLQPLKIIKALIIVNSEEFSEELYLSSRNVKNIAFLNTHEINPVDLICFDKIIITISALQQIEGRFL